MQSKDGTEIFRKTAGQSPCQEVVISKRETLPAFEWHAAVYPRGVSENKCSHRCGKNAMPIRLCCYHISDGAIVEAGVQRDAVPPAVREFLSQKMRANDVLERSVLFRYIRQVDDRLELVEEAVAVPALS